MSDAHDRYVAAANAMQETVQAFVEAFRKSAVAQRELVAAKEAAEAEKNAKAAELDKVHDEVAEWLEKMGGYMADQHKQITGGA